MPLSLVLFLGAFRLPFVAAVAIVAVCCLLWLFVVVVALLPFVAVAA